MARLKTTIALKRHVRSARRVSQFARGHSCAPGRGQPDVLVGADDGLLQVQALLEVVAAQVQHWQLTQENQASEIKHAIVEIATAIAERVIRTAISGGQFGIEQLAADACARLEGAKAELHFHPDDLTMLETQCQPEWLETISQQGVGLVADVTVTRGNCRATTGLEGFLCGIDVDLPAMKQIVLHEDLL